MISSGDQGALLDLHSHLPDVTSPSSVAGPDAVHQLQSGPALQKAISGGIGFQGLVDVNLVSWVHRHKRPDSGVDGRRLQPAPQPAGPAGRRWHHHSEPGAPSGLSSSPAPVRAAHLHIALRRYTPAMACSREDELIPDAGSGG